VQPVSVPLARLDGKVAIVTGDGSGIGCGAALALAHAGTRVVVGGVDAAGSATLFCPVGTSRASAVQALVACGGELLAAGLHVQQRV
jgi:NAD(P)-dependent dehydrogenase (short-subunit alcohol dehydrogenase family)